MERFVVSVGPTPSCFFERQLSLWVPDLWQSGQKFGQVGTNLHTRRTLLTHFGFGIFCITPTLSESGFRPLLVTRWPSWGFFVCLYFTSFLFRAKPPPMCRYRRALYFSSLSLSVSTALFPAPITIPNGLLAPGRVASRKSQMARTVFSICICHQVCQTSWGC